MTKQESFLTDVQDGTGVKHAKLRKSLKMPPLRAKAIGGEHLPPGALKKLSGGRLKIHKLMVQGGWYTYENFREVAGTHGDKRFREYRAFLQKSGEGRILERAVTMSNRKIFKLELKN